MWRLFVVFTVMAMVSGVLCPEEAVAQRHRRRTAMAARSPQPQRSYSPPPRVYHPPERVYTKRGVNEYGEPYYLTTRHDGNWQYHEGVDKTGNAFTGESFDWGDGFVSHEMESDNGKRFSGHSFDWGDGYTTYSLEDEDGNQFEFNSHDLEIEADFDRQ